MGKAPEGYERLKKLAETDPGAARRELGRYTEIAINTFCSRSPIPIFHRETVFDAIDSLARELGLK